MSTSKVTVPTSVVCVLSSIPVVYNTSASKLLAVLNVKGIPGVLISNV